MIPLDLVARSLVRAFHERLQGPIPDGETLTAFWYPAPPNGALRGAADRLTLSAREVQRCRDLSLDELVPIVRAKLDPAYKRKSKPVCVR